MSSIVKICKSWELSSYETAQQAGDTLFTQIRDGWWLLHSIFRREKAILTFLYDPSLDKVWVRLVDTHIEQVNHGKPIIWPCLDNQLYELLLRFMVEGKLDQFTHKDPRRLSALWGRKQSSAHPTIH